LRTLTRAVELLVIWSLLRPFSTVLGVDNPQSSLSPVVHADTKIHYIVDARETSRKELALTARIAGLPRGEVTLEFLSSKDNLREGGSRISGLNVMTSDGAPKSIRQQRTKFRFQNPSDEPVEISYRLKNSDTRGLGKSTYVDERRCLLNPQDAFLLPDAARSTFKVSFVLPEKWEVATLATPSVDASYELVSGRETFYLGEADRFSGRFNNCNVTLAIEADSPSPARDVWREARNQVTYLQTVAGDWKPRSLLVVLLSPNISSSRTGVSLRRGNEIFLIPPEAISGPTSAKGSVHVQLAEKLVGYFLPVVLRMQEPELQDNLTIYLALKTCLKTGTLSKTDFLERISCSLDQERPGFKSSAMPTSEIGKSRAATPTTRKMFAFFMADLALAFDGEQDGALVGAIERLLLGTKKTEAGWFLKLMREEKLSPIAEGATVSSESQIEDVLKPFGLFLRQVRIPHFNFELSETFEVTRVVPSLEHGNSNLQTGDHVLAINQNRLLGPVDLLKLRSSLGTGEYVTLTIERSGSVLTLKEKMALESSWKLAVNGLADSDKQVELEKFLAREFLN